MVIGVVCISASVCSDSEHLFGESPPIPGGTGTAEASVSESGEISLVSFVFPKTEDLGSIQSVADRTTGIQIPYRFAVWEKKVVVTLELTKGMLANPKLLFEGGASFTAFLTPENSLSTFDGLDFGNSTVFLRDHSAEIKLEEGAPATIVTGDLPSLWDGKGISKVALVNFTPSITGKYCPNLKPTGTVAMKQNTELLTWSHSLKIYGHTSICIVVVPTTDTETISFSIVAR